MRVVTLNRPKALNALNLEMVRAMTPLVQGWAADDSVALIVMNGEGTVCGNRVSTSRHHCTTTASKVFALREHAAALNVPHQPLRNNARFCFSGQVVFLDC